jgi:serine O-acetyltransferase
MNSSRRLRSDILADLRRFGRGDGLQALARTLIIERTFRLLVSYRTLRALDERLHGPLRCLLVPVRLIHAFNQFVAGADFSHRATIGPGLRIFHGRGLIVSEVAVIGSDVTVFGGVTIGRRDRLTDDGRRIQLGAPIIEDQAWIGPNALILGPVTVGRGARIAGGSVVFRDVAAGSIVGGNPAEVLRKDAPADVYSPSGDGDVVG